MAMRHKLGGPIGITDNCHSRGPGLARQGPLPIVIMYFTRRFRIIPLFLAAAALAGRNIQQSHHNGLQCRPLIL